jgi:UDP-N-acetylglucosamine 2-epimerase (non-hydrolysing)
MAGALRDIAQARSDIVVVVPLHPNPVVRRSVVPEVADVPNIRLVEPLQYPEFAAMLRRAHLVLTDSGGVQEEAPTLRTPVLVMRDTTERPEAIAAGTAKLVGTERTTITRVVAALKHILHGGRRPADFDAFSPELGVDSLLRLEDAGVTL